MKAERMKLTKENTAQDIKVTNDQLQIKENSAQDTNVTNN